MSESTTNKNQQPKHTLNVSPAQADSTLAKKRPYVPGFDVGINVHRIADQMIGAKNID